MHVTIVILTLAHGMLVVTPVFRAGKRGQSGEVLPTSPGAELGSSLGVSPKRAVSFALRDAREASDLFKVTQTVL